MTDDNIINLWSGPDVVGKSQVQIWLERTCHTTVKTELVRVVGRARDQLMISALLAEVECRDPDGAFAQSLHGLSGSAYSSEKFAMDRAISIHRAAQIALGFVQGGDVMMELPALTVARARAAFGHDFLERAASHYQAVETEVRALMAVSFEQGWKAASQHDLPSAEDIAEREAAFGCRVH